MTMSVNALSLLVYGGVFVTMITPVVLVTLLLSDWKEGKLW